MVSTTTIATFFLAATSALAGPLAARQASGKATAITSDCAEFPGSARGSNISAGIKARFVNSASPVSGNPLLPIHYNPDAQDNLGRLTVGDESDLAGNLVRCNSVNATQDGGRPYLELRGATSNDWYPLQIYNESGIIAFGADPDKSTLLRAYHIDGQDGIFFGGDDGSVNFGVGREFETGGTTTRLTVWRMQYIPTGQAPQGQLGNIKLDW